MNLDLDWTIEKLYRGELLEEATVKEVCQKFKELLSTQPNVLHLHTPITVVGNVHGQFYDLLELFRVGGRPPDVEYLFLGCYVDLDGYSVETVSLLFCLVLKYPARIHLLRGNHECKYMSKTFGFYAECIRKYHRPNVWKYFVEAFNYLPLCAVIDESIFCVHSGLSRYLIDIDSIDILDRFQDVPVADPITDLLWSNPRLEPSSAEIFDSEEQEQGYVSSYGMRDVEMFLQTNMYSQIVRSHEFCFDGYEVMFDQKLSTIWSMPNYGGCLGNVACYLEILPRLEKNYRTFIAYPESMRRRVLNPFKTSFDYFV
ncbi:protein phosphatase 2A catalytic subunit B-like [Schistocerca gregaria]|uniref:protein phosphatase 2A catalytic subunit B-like n=1 Tax=Schistocerca gregaria TaxID=7010 RepID=UPI00211EEF3B|nr:protein phosphatase 2A catalytic subunit B-like [Schistocerca gregaria]